MFMCGIIIGSYYYYFLFNLWFREDYEIMGEYGNGFKCFMFMCREIIFRIWEFMFI